MSSFIRSSLLEIEIFASMGLIVEASLYGYNCDALICGATGGLPLIGLRRPNRRMIENSSLLFKKQSISRSEVYSARLFSVGFWLNFIVSLCVADWKWRKGAVKRAFERKAHRMRLERWYESTLQVSSTYYSLLYSFISSIDLLFQKISWNLCSFLFRLFHCQSRYKLGLGISR